MQPGMMPGMMPGGMPGGMAVANPAMMQQGVPMLRSHDVPLSSGGSDSDKTDGSRPNRVPGVKDTRTPSGSPKGTSHQRGHDKTPIEQALDSIQSAKEAASDPLGDKEKDSGLYGR